ncbi:MAG TPA: SitI3 family protein, partial [Myxococcaceae bacterium]|nr:SitI3 family protein [Myxococcaceae bacterium]
MLQATLLLEHAQDAVLLFNGEIIVLQRFGGKLVFNSEYHLWNDDDWLKSRLPLPFERRPLPSPLQVERIHGILVGSFTGPFEAYQSDMHPEDRQPVPVPLGKCAERALSHLRLALEESGAEVKVESLPWVKGDETQLAQL